MMSVLKRVLPFILTLLVGVVVGSGWKRAYVPAPHQGVGELSCKIRKRQVLAMQRPQSYFESEVFTSKDVTRKAHINYKPEPLYTPEARRNNVTGTVRLRLVLAADGAVRNIVPLTTLSDGLTEQAIEAARDIKFTPASKDGRAVSQSVTVEYNFNIY